MRLVSFGEKGRETAGLLLDDKVIDIRAIDRSLPSTVRGLLEEGLLDTLSRIAAGAATKAGSEGVLDLSKLRLGPPLTNPSKIICLGLNYADHAREQSKEPPKSPLLFAKAPSSLSGPADPIVIPAQDQSVDGEAELAVVIGKVARNVDRRDAMSVVAGYMAFNDVTARHTQRGDGQWFRGKSFDTFAPCGPALVTRDEIPDPHCLAISSHINERVMQDSCTSQLIFDIPYLVSYISHSMTLVPGDIVATGTPAGVGVFRDPPVFLKVGDIVTVEIEGIGRLQNKVVAD